MKRTTVMLALVVGLVSAGSLRAETCANAPSQNSAEKGSPATTGKDGVAGTGWTGGTGGLMAGVENERKGQNPDDHNPNVAKGLDPTKDKSTGPQTKAPPC